VIVTCGVRVDACALEQLKQYIVIVLCILLEYTIESTRAYVNSI
jgi:hypothetical protein